MPTVPISMRKLKEILRLKYGVGLSHRQIGRSLAISPSVVSRYANRAAQLGIKQWPLPTGWDDTKLKHAFLQTQVKMKKHSLPDWATVHRELRNKCVTLQLLWEEYCERNPGGFYSYNHYCRMYREWLKTTSPSMRQVHKAGEKLFVDYCGPTVGVTDPETGEIRTAQVIVVNRPGFPGECFICELRLPDHRFRWKHNKLFLLLPEEYGPAFPAIVDCYTSPPT